MPYSKWPHYKFHFVCYLIKTLSLGVIFFVCVWNGDNIIDWKKENIECQQCQIHGGQSAHSAWIWHFSIDYENLSRKGHWRWLFVCSHIQEKKGHAGSWRAAAPALTFLNSEIGFPTFHHWNHKRLPPAPRKISGIPRDGVHNKDKGAGTGGAPSDAPTLVQPCQEGAEGDMNASATARSYRFRAEGA